MTGLEVDTMKLNAAVLLVPFSMLMFLYITLMTKYTASPTNAANLEPLMDGAVGFVTKDLEQHISSYRDIVACVPELFPNQPCQKVATPATSTYTYYLTLVCVIKCRIW